MALYLEKGEIEAGQLHAPFEQALRDGHLVPVCFVSARNGAGIAQLLEIFAKLLPNPAEGNPPLLYKGEGPEAVEYRSEPDPRKHVLAHVFKIVVDPFVGKLGVFRVHQGTLTKDTQLFVGDRRKPFKMGHLFMLQGKEHIEINACGPGDIAAVAKVDEIEFDCVLHDSHDEDHILYAAAGISRAHAWTRDRTETARRRAAVVRCPPQTDCRGSDAHGRTRSVSERDGAARTR